MTRGKLIQLGMHFNPSGGGADRYFAGLNQGLANNGHSFQAAAFGIPDPQTPKEISCVSLGSVEQSSRARRIAIQEFGQREIHPESIVATHFALYAHPILRLLKACTHVVHFHGPWAGESAREGQKPWIVWTKRLIEKRTYASARRLIALSPTFRDILVNEYRIDARRVAVIPGGVDLEHFRPSPSISESRRKLGWPSDKRIIFCIRRLVHRMGLEHLLEAFALVASSHPEALLVIAGKGPLSEQLHQLSAKLGLENRVKFAGYVADEDLPDAYSAADFSIVPSQALEGFGLITVESLACGTPVLVAPIGGLPDTVRGLDASLILSDSSREAIAAGLVRGLSQTLPSREECRRYAEQNFSWSDVARRVFAIYEEAANDPFH